MSICTEYVGCQWPSPGHTANIINYMTDNKNIHSLNMGWKHNYVHGSITLLPHGYKWGCHMALYVNKGVVNKSTCWYFCYYWFVLTGGRIMYSNCRVWWLHQTRKGRVGGEGRPKKYEFFLLIYWFLRLTTIGLLNLTSVPFCEYS